MAGSDLALKFANHHAIVLNYINATLERPKGQTSAEQSGGAAHLLGLGCLHLLHLGRGHGAH